MFNIKKNNKIATKLLLFFMLLTQFRCILDMALKPAEKTVKIEFGIVELNQPVNGTVGFCGLFDYYIFRPPLSHAFETGLKYEDLNELPKLFLKEIGIYDFDFQND